MTRKYISTEMLIIFTTLMIIANFTIYFLKKLAFTSTPIRMCTCICRVCVFS